MLIEAIKISVQFNIKFSLNLVGGQKLHKKVFTVL